MTTLDIDIEEDYNTLEQSWAVINNLQNQLYETNGSLDDFQANVDELKEARNEQNAIQKKIDRDVTERSLKEEERNGLYQYAYLQEVKAESDYRALWVSRLKEEIAKEEAKIKAAKGSDDEDLITAMSTAVIGWFNEGLAQQKEIAADRLEEYQEVKLRWDT